MATQFERPRTFASKQRAQRLSLSPVRERLTKAFRPAESASPPGHGAEADLDGILARFRIVRQGYDCLAVDRYIEELERELAEADRELAEVRGQPPAADEVHSELKRIGEQTSAVLIAAHEQRDEILRAAREEADRSVAEAAAKASALAAEGEARVRELQAQKDTIQRQRDRLLEDVRSVSSALAALADSTPERTAAQE